jgi:hypothetical protein
MELSSYSSEKQRENITQHNTQRTMTNRMRNGMKNTGKILYDTGKKPFNMTRRYLILNLIDRYKLMKLLKQAIINNGINEESLKKITLYDILKKDASGKVNVDYITETVSIHRNINNNQGTGMKGSGKKPVKKATTKKPVKKAPAKKPAKKSTTKKSTTKKPVKKATKK